MNVNLNADGTMNRTNRPYYQFEDDSTTTLLWDPHGISASNYGLYTQAQPTPTSVQTQYFQGGYNKRAPAAIIDPRTGRVTRPSPPPPTYTIRPGQTLR